MALEDALYSVVSGLSAVQTLLGSSNPIVRPFKFEEGDNLAVAGGILITPVNADHKDTLDERGGGVSAIVKIRSVAEKAKQARALSEAVRSNGTNPGTGLVDYSGTTSGFVVQAVTLNTEEYDFVPYGDDSDEGLFIFDYLYQVDYFETP